MKLFKAILWTLAAVVLPVDNCCDGAVCRGHLTLEAELPTIRKAAERNGIKFGSDDWFILLAIRKAENGADGRQFGIMNPKAYNLDTQAGWAAATVIKNRARWVERCRPCYDYIEFLANRYVPVECDPEGNENWKRNVRFWFEKFEGYREKMREIKFRAWDKKNKRMLEVLSIDWSNRRIYFSVREDRYGDAFVESLNFHEVVLIQFTGCKDMNRKEIYEGDIAKWRNFVFSYKWLGKGYGCISIKDGEMLDNKFLELEVEEKDFEVIGNIYENPELLKNNQ